MGSAITGGGCFITGWSGRAALLRTCLSPLALSDLWSTSTSAERLRAKMLMASGFATKLVNRTLVVAYARDCRSWGHLMAERQARWGPGCTQRSSCRRHRQGESRIALVHLGPGPAERLHNHGSGTRESWRSVDASGWHQFHFAVKPHRLMANLARLTPRDGSGLIRAAGVKHVISSLADLAHARGTNSIGEVDASCTADDRAHLAPDFGLG